MQFIKELFSTSKVPYVSIKQKIKALALAFFFGKICDVIVSISKGLLRDFNLPYTLERPLQSVSYSGNGSGYLFFLICYSAIYEEIAFRLHLKPSTKNLNLSLSLLAVLIVKITLRNFAGLYHSIEILNYSRDIVLIALFYLILNQGLRNFSYNEFYLNNRRLVYYSSIALWVAFHFSNYENVMSHQFLPLIFLAVFNLFWYGLLFSHLRVAGGILIVVIFHIVTNVVKLML